MYMYMCTDSLQYMRISVNHNSLRCEQPTGLDVNQPPNVQDVFRPIPGLVSCAGVTGTCTCIHSTCTCILIVLQYCILI